MKSILQVESRGTSLEDIIFPDETHVRCVHLRIPDLARALDFYQRVIGFKLIERGESEASLSANCHPPPSRNASG